MHVALLLPPSQFVSQLADRLADLLRVSSSALIAAIWQGAILVLVAAVALRLAPRIPAATRFAIWFSVFAVIAALPFLGLSFNLGAGPGTVASSRPAWLTLNPRWTLAIAAVWAVASLTRAMTLIAAALRVRSLSRRAVTIEFPSTLDRHTNRRAQVCSSADVDRPTVIGFFSPKILIPAWLLEKLTPAELEQVILHEAGHLNRADDWLNLLQKLALVLFPLNPALAWVERRLCFERELACDERVLNFLAARTGESGRAATGYASCLATLAGYRLERRNLVRNLALALGALGANADTSARHSELGRRIVRILRPVSRINPLYSRFAVAGAVLSLLFAAAELERCPQIVSFAAPSAPGASAANLSPAQSNLLPGYRAIAARITLPAPAPRQTTMGDAAPNLASSDHESSSPVTPTHSRSPEAIPARTSRPQRPSSDQPRMIATRQIEPSQPEGDVVISRWTTTVWQSAYGARIVRTSAVISNIGDSSDADGAAAADQNHSRTSDSINPATRNQVPAARPRQISQPLSRYEAVPVPGGWLVIQL